MTGLTTDLLQIGLDSLEGGIGLAVGALAASLGVVLHFAKVTMNSVIIDLRSAYEALKLFVFVGEFVKVVSTVKPRASTGGECDLAGRGNRDEGVRAGSRGLCTRSCGVREARAPRTRGWIA